MLAKWRELYNTIKISWKRDNMEETFYETVNRLKAELPVPSEVDGESCAVQYMIRQSLDSDIGCPSFGQITFEKEYLDGMCIGWKLSD
jgi:hypothetical protein